MNKLRKIIGSILCTMILYTFVSCDKDNSDITIDTPIENDALSFSELRTKYLDLAIEYGQSKNPTTKKAQVESLSFDEKVALFNILANVDTEETANNNALKTTTFDDAETDEEDDEYYGVLCDQLIEELNSHPAVLAVLAENNLPIEHDIMYYIEEQSFSKMAILEEQEQEEQPIPSLKLAQYTGHAKWGTYLRYRFSKDVNSTRQAAIRSAMNEWCAATNNKLKPLEIKNNFGNQLAWTLGLNYHSYIYSYKASESGVGLSTLGCVPWAVMKFHPTNAGTVTYRHEIGHTLGLIHEHQRYDRDDYIIVNENNIKQNKSQYNKTSKVLSKTYGAFDFESIMIYSSKSSGNAKDPNKPIMTKKDGTTTWNRIGTLSPLDKEKIKEIYK